MTDLRAILASLTGGQPRHYPPGVILHAPHCIEGGNAMASPIAAAFEAHPNHQLHFCFASMLPLHLADDPVRLAKLMPEVSVEVLEYRRHPYTPCDPRHPDIKQPPNAIRPICKVCRGTHQGESR